MDSSSHNRIFQHYYKEIESLISELKVEIDQAYSSLLSLEERKNSLQKAERLLNEASQSFHSLELEAYSENTDSESRSNVERVSSLKKQLERLRKEWKDAKIILSEERDKLERNDLLRQVESDLESGSLEQRQKFVSVTGKLEKGNEILHNSRRTLEETEQVTRGILEDLSTQRQTIMHTREGLSRIDAALLRSRGLLSSMTRRALANKLILYLVAAVFALAGLFIVFSKFRRP
ncbi:hypothetical protein GAYE_SCF03G2372 [Galdieria yellowstonensis]|uniref:Vesicle transport v-SNARE N-terminal domain-containing protein n=1 Tax=Galdieria yellowstonensis TaxID=3028027 RepID=A0AAV9IB82_9RHOD|nr:hypothetical protein GAYE_SCF03G2372 [Galdieria yellowstonensis]